METREIYYILINYCLVNKITISTMESCTSGCIASLITDIEGASEIFPGSIVTYSNTTKEMFGVPHSTIEKYGVYSKETAIAMANAIREIFGTNIGIGVSGSLGRVDPMNSDSISGEVHFAINLNGNVKSFKLDGIADERHTAKLIVAESVANELIGMIKENE